MLPFRVGEPDKPAQDFFSSSMASPKKKLQGLVAATITPMTEHGEINFSVIGRYVDYLVEEQGVKNIFVNGTTGEGLSLSISERCRVAEEWVTEGRNKLDQIVIHVGALSLKESQELAQHAAKIGADGIAVIAPFFLQPWNKDVLINFLKEVAAAAPALPFYYYHIPALTGVKIRAEELLDGIQDKIPTFQGLKFSDTDLLDFGQCVDQNRQQQFAFLFGVDEQLLSALVMGATGAVGSTYNYLGKKTNQMLEAFERKDFSSALNHQRKLHRSLRWTDRRQESRAVLGGTPKSSNVRGGDAQRRFASGVLSLEENAKLRGKWAAGKCHQPQRVSQPPLKSSLKRGKPWNLSSWVLCRFHPQPPCCSGHRL
uniref:N-acetylneuraminate lyase n=1 Tax=Tursiops truncatus TaxID=9739 RepID=A0A6J3R4I3_TURTR|nr:N-acetylneuraminate lyase isoform X1 [Tursiops truncatus]